MTHPSHDVGHLLGLVKQANSSSRSDSPLYETVQETLNPTGPGEQDEFTEWMRSPHAQFDGAKRLPDGTYAGIKRLAFTNAICLGVTYASVFTTRYCYDNATVCYAEFSKLESMHDVPAGWIARRPER